MTYYFFNTKITHLQKPNLKLFSVSGVIFFKMASFFAFVCLFIATPMSGKISMSESNEDPKIIVSGEAIVFDSGDLVNIEKTYSEDLKEIATQKAQIFISDDATVYNIEAFSNAEIKTKTIRKKKISLIQKKDNKKIATGKTSNPYLQNKLLLKYYNSIDHSESIFQNQKEKIVFTTGSSQYLIKIIISLIKRSERRLYLITGQVFSYSDPSIRLCYFSGKHSVRPPTHLS